MACLCSIYSHVAWLGNKSDHKNMFFNRQKAFGQEQMFECSYLGGPTFPFKVKNIRTK